MIVEGLKRILVLIRGVYIHLAPVIRIVNMSVKYIFPHKFASIAMSVLWIGNQTLGICRLSDICTGS